MPTNRTEPKGRSATNAAGYASNEEEDAIRIDSLFIFTIYPLHGSPHLSPIKLNLLCNSERAGEVSEGRYSRYSQRQRFPRRWAPTNFLSVRTKLLQHITFSAWNARTGAWKPRQPGLTMANLSCGFDLGKIR